MCTMFAKKAPPNSAPPPPAYRQELEYLYARRLAIDSLIASLEDYANSGAPQLDEADRQTA